MWETEEREKSRVTQASKWSSRGTIYSKGKLWWKRFEGNKNLNLDILSLKFILNQNVKNATFKPRCGMYKTWILGESWQVEV